VQLYVISLRLKKSNQVKSNQIKLKYSWSVTEEKSLSEVNHGAFTSSLQRVFSFFPFFFVRVSVRKEGRETLIWGFESVDPCKVASWQCIGSVQYLG
jgi:hypothetical protein